MAIIGSFSNMAYLPMKLGAAILVGGTVVVSDTGILTSSQVFVTTNTVGGTLGIHSVALSGGSGFTVNSTNVLDTSTVKYMIIY